MSLSPYPCQACKIYFSSEDAFAHHHRHNHPSEPDLQYSNAIELESHPALTETLYHYGSKSFWSTEPNLCEDSIIEIDGFDQASFNETPSTEAYYELESHLCLDPPLTETLYHYGSESFWSTEPNLCEDSLIEIDCFDQASFNETPSTEAYYELESHMYLDPPLTETWYHDAGEPYWTTEPNLCGGSLIEMDCFDQASLIEVSSTEIECDVCHEVFTKWKELAKHRKLTHPELLAHECGVCHKVFTKWKALAKHKKLTHPELLVQECGVCNKKFTNRHALMRHKKFCDNRNNYECNVCYKAFALQKELKNHQKLTHPELLVHECDVCHKFFFTATDLISHKKCCHSGNKYECSVCHEAFALSSLLTNHQKLTHPELLAHKCNFCDKPFLNRYDLIRHKKNFHNKQIKYECDVCHRGFKSQSQLQGHQKFYEGKTVHEYKAYRKEVTQKRVS